MGSMEGARSRADVDFIFREVTPNSSAWPLVKLFSRQQASERSIVPRHSSDDLPLPAATVGLCVQRSVSGPRAPSRRHMTVEGGAVGPGRAAVRVDCPAPRAQHEAVRGPHVRGTSSDAAPACSGRNHPLRASVIQQLVSADTRRRCDSTMHRRACALEHGDLSAAGAADSRNHGRIAAARGQQKMPACTGPFPHAFLGRQFLAWTSCAGWPEHGRALSGMPGRCLDWREYRPNARRRRPISRPGRLQLGQRRLAKRRPPPSRRSPWRWTLGNSGAPKRPASCRRSVVFGRFTADTVDETRSDIRSVHRRRQNSRQSPVCSSAINVVDREQNQEVLRLIISGRMALNATRRRVSVFRYGSVFRRALKTPVPGRAAQSAPNTGRRSQRRSGSTAAGFFHRRAPTLTGSAAQSAHR